MPHSTGGVVETGLLKCPAVRCRPQDAVAALRRALRAVLPSDPGRKDLTLTTKQRHPVTQPLNDLGLPYEIRLAVRLLYDKVDVDAFGKSGTIREHDLLPRFFSLI